MKKRQKYSITKSEILEVIKLDKEGKYQHEISDIVFIAPTNVSAILNYYRGKDNKTSKRLYKGYREIIDEIKNSSNEPVETVRVKPRMIKNKVIMKLKLILSIVLCNLFLHIYIGSDLYYQIKQSKQHHERFDALVRDSVKMHKIYENWEINYGELKKLEE